MGLIQEQAVKDTQKGPTGLQLDVCHWMSRATLDVIGLAGAFLLSVCITPINLRRRLVLCSGFDYHLNAIQNEDNELLKAYEDMFRACDFPNLES